MTHGLTGTPEYKIWAGMISRCTNEKEFSYRYYGARGIKVCDRWTGEDGFKNFISDIGPRPSKGHSLERDRINDGYQPDNCRWATRLEQANNKQNTMRVVFDGKLTALKTVCQILNKDYKFVRYRMVRGYSFEDAITIPKNFRREEWQAGARQSA